MSGINEIHFEDTVYDYLKESRLYTSRVSQQFDLDYVLDTELLKQFITTTQPEIWQKLEKHQCVRQGQQFCNCGWPIVFVTARCLVLHGQYRCPIAPIPPLLRSWATLGKKST